MSCTVIDVVNSMQFSVIIIFVQFLRHVFATYVTA